jgi:raffinose/stachyose/melibiose transport system substrate-binding protein
MKKISYVLWSLMIASLSGCSHVQETENKGTQINTDDRIKISVYSTTSDPSIQEIYKQIANEFKKENPPMDIDFQFPGSEYENMLKIKMAANDLPDIIDTHGWAITRYGKYLADLRNEPWTSQMTDTIKDVVTDKDGKVYALVLCEAKDGVTYNADLLKKYSIEPPRTFDALMDAAEIIKTKSEGQVTPFFFSGVDNWTIGQFFDVFANAQLISPTPNDAEALLNNTFDWKKWTPLPERYLDMQKKGYINKDVMTVKYSDFPTQFAKGTIAFTFSEPTFVDEVHKIAPDLNIGFMPVPSIVPGDEPTFSGGERYTMGVWKDSKHLNEAKKLVDFFAQKENMEKIVKGTKLPPGLKGIVANHEFSKFYDQYASIRVLPFFDRVYLPNGMWETLRATSTQLLTGTITPEQYSEKMKNEVERLSLRN